MKTIYKIFITANFILCILTSATAQYMTSDGILPSLSNKSKGNNEVSNAFSPDTATVICDGNNTFWGLDGNNLSLLEFTLSNNIISSTGRSIPSSPGSALAICNNLNGGPISPTIYSCITNDNYYWNGNNNWVATGTSVTPLVNAGGYGNYLYFIDNIFSPYEITKYDGTNYTVIHNMLKMPAVADISVDASGNAYVITYQQFPNTDSLYIISPAGQIIKQYPLAFDLINLYGSFLLNGKLYVGAGTMNATYPNQLIQISFTATSASIDTALSFPGSMTITGDLASCNPGLPLGINTVPEETKFSIYPTLAFDVVTLTTPEISGTTYRLFDIEGKTLIETKTIFSNTTIINVRDFKKGVYFIEIKNKKSVVRKKFVKM